MTASRSGAVHLPTETLEQIIYEAWTASSMLSSERRQIFDSLSAAHPWLHQIVVRIAIRYARFDCSEETADDLDFYRTVCEQATRLFAGKPVPGVPDDAHTAPALFTNSHVRLEGLVHDRHPSRSRQRLEELFSLVRDCASFTFTTPALASQHPLASRQAIPALLSTYLQSLRSLRTVHFDCYFQELAFTHASVAPAPLPHVRSLRLKHFPPCECGPCPHARHRPSCLAATLLAAFPGLRVLHLENAVFLKGVRAPPTLETLVLDAPPMARIARYPAYSSVLEYNVASAVRRGLMRDLNMGEDRESAGKNLSAAGRKRIVVRTGREDPYGWAGARVACEDCGVELVKEVVFLHPVERLDPALVGKGRYDKPSSKFGRSTVGTD